MLTIAVLLAALQGPELVLERTHRFGSVENLDQAFEDVAGAALLPNGGLAIADAGLRRVSVFDLGSGQLVQHVGREGSGPGEFRFIHDLRANSRGLFVLDMRLGRLTQFTRGGDLVETWGLVAPAFIPAGLVTRPPIAVGRDGTRAVIPTYRAATVESVPMLSLAPRLDAAKVIAELRVAERSIQVRTDHISATFPQRVGGHTLWDVAPDTDAILLVDRAIPSSDEAPARFRVRVVGFDGTMHLSRSFTAGAAVRITEEQLAAERALWVDGMMSRSNGPPISRQQAEELARRGVRESRFQAPVDRVVALRGGGFLIRRGAFQVPQAEWWLFDGDARLLGHFQLPSNAEVFGGDARRLVVGETGDLDEAYVSVFRVSQKD